MSYSPVGPPFDFLGHLSETQKGEFYSWINAREGKLGDIEVWWRIRAQQFRKSAGVLEKWYKDKNDQSLSPRWSKDAWSPSPEGHFLYSYRDDQVPSVCVSEIKSYFQEQLSRDDEGVFQMNHIRTLIEKFEDKAQDSREALGKVETLKADLDRYFSQPEFQAVLVRDQSDQYKGESRYRTNQLDPPTAWEKELYGSFSTNSKIKES